MYLSRMNRVSHLIVLKLKISPFPKTDRVRNIKFHGFDQFKKIVLR